MNFVELGEVTFLFELPNELTLADTHILLTFKDVVFLIILGRSVSRTSRMNVSAPSDERNLVYNKKMPAYTFKKNLLMAVLVPKKI